MARLARAVFPGHPHHVTQRGNGRATTFFSDEDYARYRDFAALIAAGEDAEMSLRLRRAETIGRPVGDADFIGRLERESGRLLVPGKRGRRPKEISALSP